MSALSVQRYSPTDADRWNAFVATSRNGTFLFDRGFMDYHADRFEDHSLVVTSSEQIVALLPANASGETLASHGGLTYGGFVTGPKMDAGTMVEVVGETLAKARSEGFTRLLYKPVPHFYHRIPAEDDLYALHQAGARPVRVDLASAIRLQNSPGFSKSKRHGVKSARKAGLEVHETRDWAGCWHLLEAVLSERHDTRPTHSLTEIERLAASFPEHIRLFGAFRGADMVAALVIFDCDPTAHVQYIASSPEGRAVGGIDLIVDHLLTDTFRGRLWLDFGISTVDQGRTLNIGLARQKEMFGARSVIYQQLEVTL